MSSDPEATCKGTNVRGERCAKRAVRGRFCLTHAGAQDMRELGRKGGKVSPQTRLRKNADDSLREQARAVLERALAGEDMPKSALDSARSLFSYRADVPPVAQQVSESALRTASGRHVVGLADVLELALEDARGILEDPRMQEVILQAAERVHELQGAGVPVDSASITGSPSPSDENR